MASLLRRIGRGMVGCILVLIVLVCMGYWDGLMQSVTVHNRSPLSVSDAKIVLGGQLLFTGDMQPFEGRTFHGTPRNSSELVVALNLDGRHLETSTYISGIGGYIVEVGAPGLRVDECEGSRFFQLIGLFAAGHKGGESTGIPPYPLLSLF